MSSCRKKDVKWCVYKIHSSSEGALCSDNELAMLSARTFKSVSRKHLTNVCHVTGFLPLPFSTTFQLTLQLKY